MALVKPSPYFLSSVVLGIYVFSIIILSKNPTLVDLSRYAGFVLAGIFAFEFVVNREKLLWPVEFTTFAAFLALMIIAALWAHKRDNAITLSLTFFQLLMFGVIAVNIMVARGSIKPLIFGLLAGLLWAVIVALNEQNFRFMAAASYTRVGSVLNNPNSYAVSLLIGCMLVWHLLQNSERRIPRVILIALILLFLHQIIFYAGSRKGVLAIFLLYPVFLLLRQISQPKISLYRIAGTLLLIGVLYITGWHLIEKSVFFSRIEMLQEEFIEGVRGQMIAVALELWRNRPLLGQGTGQFRVVSPWNSYSHNNYVELLANNGLLGFLLFYSFFAVMIKKYLRLFGEKCLTVASLSWLLTFALMLLVLDLGMVSYYEKSTWLAYITLVALSYIHSRENPFGGTPPGCAAGEGISMSGASEWAS